MGSDRKHEDRSRCNFRDRRIALSQGIYPIAHPSLGAMELFLVPIQGDASGRRYEAVFN